MTTDETEDEESYEDLADMESLLYSFVYHETKEEFSCDNSFVGPESSNCVVDVLPCTSSPMEKLNVVQSETKDILIIDLSDDEVDEARPMERKRKRSIKKTQLTPKLAFQESLVMRWSDSESESSSTTSEATTNDVSAENLSVGLTSVNTKRKEVLPGPCSSSLSIAGYSTGSGIDLSSMSMEDVFDRLPDGGWTICAEDYQQMGSSNRYYKRRRTIECKICRGFGHNAHQCPQKGLPKLCYICCEEYHYARKCPARPCVLCFTVGDHTTHSCCKGRKKMWNTTCASCGCQGHSCENCPDDWRQYAVPSGSKAKVTQKKVENRVRKKYCFNCGRRGHLGHLCREPSFPSTLVPFSPFPGSGSVVLDKKRSERNENSAVNVKESKQQRRLKTERAARENNAQNNSTIKVALVLNSKKAAAGGILSQSAIKTVRPISKRRLLKSALSFANGFGLRIGGFVKDWKKSRVSKLVNELSERCQRMN